jgi:hypothetical protein
MNANVDLAKGGYQGDPIEEMFKTFTSSHLSFWWHFREVLRASHAASPNWKRSDSTALLDGEQRELIALSLLNYAVYTGIGEAIAFFDQMQNELNSAIPANKRIFEVRRLWKARYSSLYSSFNALCNIVCIVVGQKSPFGNDPRRVWNHTPKNACDLVNGRDFKALSDPVARCRGRLEIRDHLDHYWVIWHSISQGRFLFDDNFTKGYVPIHPATEVSITIDARKRAHDDVEDTSDDFNLIYRELVVTGGFFDKYLQAKDWKIDYLDYGPPHNGQRPLP